MSVVTETRFNLGHMQTTPFGNGEIFHGGVKESTPRLLRTTIEREALELRGVYWDTTSNVLIERGISWWCNIVQLVRPCGYILHVEGDNSTMKVPQLDGHGVGVEENSNIPCFIQKLIQRRSACKQEGTFAPGSETS